MNSEYFISFTIKFKSLILVKLKKKKKRNSIYHWEEQEQVAV